MAEPRMLGRGDTPRGELGRWVHVYADAVSRRPTPIPAVIRTALEGLRRRVSEEVSA
jgi:hypothetical protein